MNGFLSIKDTIKTYISSCQAKKEMPLQTLMGKSILAGAFIGFGAAASSVAAHGISDVGIARLVAAVVFPVGLMMVIMLGAELFTGDCLMAMSVCDKKVKTLDLVRVLVTVYVGNFIGAALLAVLIAMSGQMDYSGGMLGAYTIKVAVSKVNLSFTNALVSGILCNILVCTAVLMALSAKDIAGKLLAVFFTIMLFVTAGFEHCVANMYYITAGLVAKMNPEYVNLAMDTYGYTFSQLGSLNISGFLINNLLPVTIGNIIGGAVCLGIPLYILHTGETKENTKVKINEDAKVKANENTGNIFI